MRSLAYSRTSCLLRDKLAALKSLLMRRTLCLLSILALASCAPPGRDTLAPTPVGATPFDIKTADAFAGRIALVSILPGTEDFQTALKQAIGQALAIKPNAVFEVQAEAPDTNNADQNIQALNDLAPEAEIIARTIIADGVPANRVTLGAKSAGLTPAILVYVK